MPGPQNLLHRSSIGRSLIRDNANRYYPHPSRKASPRRFDKWPFIGLRLLLAKPKKPSKDPQPFFTSPLPTTHGFCMPFMGHSHISHTVFAQRLHVSRMVGCRFVLSGVAALCMAGCATAPRPAVASPVAQPVTASTLAPVATPEPVVTPTPTPTQPWVVQPIAANANQAASSVAEAVRTGTHGERLSPMLQPAPFDAARYARDPAYFLSTTEPGRVYQSAQPGPGVPVLTPVGTTTVALQPGRSTMLSVRVPAGQPLSWLSGDLGSFQNGLVSITTAAGADGVATVVFTATPGTSGRVTILAASPVATGQVRFVVDVQQPSLTPAPTVAPTTTPSP